MKLYLAYPNPMGKSAQVGNVYNDGGEVLWDCRCGATGLLAGGQSGHICWATKDEKEANKIQVEMEKAGTPTEHPNVFDVPDDKINQEFLSWLKEVGEIK